MDGVLIGRRERIHSGVLIWRICGLVCATSKELLAVVVQDSHRVKAGLPQSNSTTPLVDNDAYEVSSDVSLAGYICTHICLFYVFAERLPSD